jgi:phosphate transport system ATP-binding protein
MAKQIDLKDVDIYYGDFLAVEGVTLTIPPHAVTRSSARPGVKVDRAAHPSTSPHVDPTWDRRTVVMVFQRPNTLPTTSSRFP